MKKLLLVIASLATVIGLCSCGGSGGMFSKATPTPIPVLSPTDILSPAEVTEYVNYEAVQDGDIAENNHARSVVYVSNPKGKSDSVTVKIMQSGSNLSAESVKKQFDDARQKRSSAESVDGLGSEAYIAFPSIHVYDRGCEITISAGSGSDEGQRALLKRMAERAVMNLEGIIPADSSESSSSGNVKQE